jgi:hypothetical protein
MTALFLYCRLIVKFKCTVYLMSKYVALLFSMVCIICTPQKCSGFNQIEEAKVSFRDVWLDTLAGFIAGVGKRRILSRG